MIQALKKHRKIVIAVLLVLGLLAIKFLSGPRHSDPVIENKKNDSVERLPNEKTADVIAFGIWSPEQNRAVLAQIESDNEVTVTSELNGTLSTINAKIGDTVRNGQILARFKITNDPTQVNYLNSVSNLTATEATAQSNIKSAEIALRNAQAELEQTLSQQGQDGSQSLTSLRTQCKAAETTFSNAITFLDRQLGATPAYERENVFGRLQIGSRNFLLRNKTESDVRFLVSDFELLQRENPQNTRAAIVEYAEDRIKFANRIQTQLNNYNLLIRDTIVSAAFTTTDQDSIQSQLDALRPTIDNVIVNVTSLIENTKGTTEGSRTTILAAQNRVRTAQEQLEIAKAQAEAQMIGAQAQVNSAAASQTDLIVRAPISGKIVDEQVNQGSQVSIGTPLFTIINEQASKKVVAFLSQDELQKVQNSPNITIEINGENITTEKSFLSARVDPDTQKIRAEFLLPQEVSVLVGSFVKILVPLQSIDKNLLPISAIAFEPDGPEVLILDENNIATRQKIAVGDIVADSVQVNGGINASTKVIRYRNRVFSGEKVIENQ